VLDIIDEFNDSVDYIIDGGESLIGLESTVVKVIDNVPTILRPGFITREDIEEIIGKCNVSEYLFKKAECKVESPGMLYKHYSPNTPCMLCDKEIINNFVDKNKKIIIIGHDLDIDCYKYYDYGNDLKTIAHNIFKLLRKADKEKADLIIIEATTIKSLGLAIMNRLIRTCNYNYKRKDENN
jgi:L-threonylcarbamoyladenylate synthase